MQAKTEAAPIKCPMCAGRGRVYSVLAEAEVDCSACDGTGLFPAPETRPQAYVNKNGREVFVADASAGAGTEFCAFREVPGRKPRAFGLMVSKALPMVTSRSRAQRNLDAYAKLHGWRPIMTCRVCGCTNSRACPEGCYWVEDGLCSACAEGQRAAEKEVRNG